MNKRDNRWARKLVLLMTLAFAVTVGMTGAFAISGGAPAHASGLDIGGATGLLTIPTADVAGTGRLVVGYHAVGPYYYNVYKNSIAVTAGLTNELELGVSSAFAYGDRETSFNAKYRFLPESSHVPALAIGVDNSLTGRGTDFYLVLSKAIPELTTRFHAGVGNWGLFLGASKVLNPVSVRGGRGSTLPETTLMAEWNAGLLNLGVRMQPIPHLLLDAGVIGLNTVPVTPVLGLEYAFQF